MVRIGVIGIGSIGETIARGLSKIGYPVAINDRDSEKEEPVPLPALGKEQMANRCDMIIVAVPTPTVEDGGDDSIVKEVLATLDMYDCQATVVVRSTMPPGSTEEIAKECSLDLVYSPEFMRDRDGMAEFLSPDRIVIAGPEESRADFREVVETPKIDCDTIIELDDYTTAEVAKEAHNAFFATKVSFANQMRLICDQTGSDASQVMDIVKADSRNTDSHLDPLRGPFGGQCLPKDTNALKIYANSHGVEVSLLEAVFSVNETTQEKYLD